MFYFTVRCVTIDRRLCGAPAYFCVSIIQAKEQQAMYSSSDLKKGLKIMIDGEPYVIEGFDFTKPGKGQALYKCKLRNMITGSLFDRTYRSGENFEPAPLEERDMQYQMEE